MELNVACEQHSLNRVDKHITFPAGSETLGTGETAHGVSAGTEGGTDWVLLAEPTCHGAAQSLQLAFQFPGTMENGCRVE